MEITNLNSFDNCFTTLYDVTPSTAAAVLSLQQGSANNRTIRMLSAFLYAAGATTITLELNGTVSTAAASTISNVNPKNPLAQTTGATATGAITGAGAGTVIGKYVLAAGTILSIDLSYIDLPPNTASANISLRASSGSTEVTLQFTWREI